MNILKTMKAYFSALLLAMAAGQVCAAEILLQQIKVPTVAAELKTPQKAYSRIESAVITDSLGRVAKGLHNVYVTVSDAAPYPLVVQGQEIKPGETKTIAVNLSNTGNRLSMPIHPSRGQIAGVAEYEVVINNIRVEVCPEFFTEGKIDCYRILTQIAQPDCKLDMTASGADSCTTQSVITKQTSCETGYTLNGYVCEKIQVVDKVNSCDPGYSLTANSTCEKISYTPLTPCKAGETFDGTSCIATSLELAVNFACPEGTTLSTTNPNYCERNVVTTPALNCDGQPVTTTEQCSTDAGGATTCLSYNLDYGSCSARVYSDAKQVCPVGFTEDNQGKCTLTQSYTLNNYCDNGYTMVNNATCSRVETITGTPYCDTGYTLGGWDCSKSVSQPASPNCASGYTWNGTTCSQTLTQNANTNCTPAAAYYNGTQCQYDQSKWATGRCSTGSWDGSDCAWKETSTPTNWDCPSSHPNPSQTYSFRCFDELPSSPQEEGCPGGWEWRLHRCVQYAEPINVQCQSGYYWDGGNCSTTRYTSPDYYYCSSGWSLSGTKCYKTTYSTATLTCPSGYTLNGSTCSKTVTAAPTSYSCPANYTLSGTNCTTTLTAPAQASCPTGYNNIGQKDCTRTLTAPSKANCPTGYTERLGTCEMTVSMPAVPQCSAPYTYDITTKMCKQEIRVPKYL